MLPRLLAITKQSPFWLIYWSTKSTSLEHVIASIHVQYTQTESICTLRFDSIRTVSIRTTGSQDPWNNDTWTFLILKMCQQTSVDSYEDLYGSTRLTCSRSALLEVKIYEIIIIHEPSSFLKHGNKFQSIRLRHFHGCQTLPVFLGVSKFFMKSPSLPVRAPNLPGTTYCVSFYISYSLISWVMYCCCIEKSEIQRTKGPLIKLAPTLKIFEVVSRFLYFGCCLQNWTFLPVTWLCTPGLLSDHVRWF